MSKFVPLQKICQKNVYQVVADLSTLKSQLRKDGKFSQGVRPSAVYQTFYYELAIMVR
jgi:hypothetical protein